MQLDMHCLCLFCRSESHGLVTSSAAGSGKAPPPYSPFLRNGARGSPSHSRGSDTDLPPVT